MRSGAGFRLAVGELAQEPSLALAVEGYAMLGDLTVPYICRFVADTYWYHARLERMKIIRCFMRPTSSNDVG